MTKTNHSQSIPVSPNVFPTKQITEKQTKITEENLKDFKIPGLTFKPGGSITISGNAKMNLNVDGEKVEIKND